MPLPCQLPTQPITKHVQKAVVPLPEPTNQLQSHVQSEILPRPLSQHHPICIIMMCSILSVFILYLYLYLFVSSMCVVLFISNSVQ